MKKNILATGVMLLPMLSAFAVQVEVNSASYVQDQTNIDAFSSYLKNKRGFTANRQQDLEKNLKDDWLLANNYYDKHATMYDKAEIVNLVNRHLAKKEVKRIQKSIEISDEITKSYYLDNLNKYTLKPILNLKIFSFKSLQEAFDFYIYADANGFEKAQKYADVNSSIKQEEYKASQNKTLPVFRRVMKDMNCSDYFAPPLFHQNRFFVLYVDSIEKQDGYLEYDNVKDHIAKMLYNKTYLKKRKEIVDKLEKL